MRMTSTSLLLAASGLLGAGNVTLSIAANDAARAPQAQDRDPIRSPVQRGAITPAKPRVAHPAAGGGAATYPAEFRTIDGIGNNAANPTWGSSGITLIRAAAAEYGNGTDTPAGALRPGAREVSNIMAAQPSMFPNPSAASDYLWQWGQFLDHDIDETPVTSPGEPFDIPVPTGDEHFDPLENGGVMIPLDRSAWTLEGGVRQQLNNITAFIDASNVYGADTARALELRRLGGFGKLRIEPNGMLPFNTNGFPNAPTGDDPTLFLAGDVRANEQNGLTAMHTLFVREHNRVAEEISNADPLLTGDEVYERARAIVAAEMQSITYNEFLPLLLGPGALPAYDGYRPDVNPGITNMFATSAYRVGHTMLSSQIMRLDGNGDMIPDGHIALADAFFRPDEIMTHGIEPLLRGLAAQMCQNIDAYLIDDVRNFLFGPPGAGGFDLAALNIQRGRDHGLATYNQTRIAFGLSPVTTFADITPDAEIQMRLSMAYDSVDDIDAWVGMLAEPHVPGALVGETVHAVLVDQFTRLRDGDRFWYTTYLPPALVAQVESDTLADIIRRNTTIDAELPDDVFIVDNDPCAGDFDGNGAVGFSDLNQLLSAWGPCAACPEDLDASGTVGFADLNALLGMWGDCP